MSDARKPKVFRIEPEPSDSQQPRPARPSARALILADEPDVFSAESTKPEEAPLKPRRGGFSFWTKLFWSALTGLLSLAVGLWFWRLVDELIRTNVYVGWFAIGLVGLAVVALAALTIREVRGIRSLTAATELREQAELVAISDDGAMARDIVARLLAYQAKDPATARQRQAMEGHLTEIIDGRGLLILADRTLMMPRDELARNVIAAAAKRVSVVTAISPRAIVDVLFVAAQSVMLTRRIAEIYGARPGTLGFMRLGRRILGHLAITGGVAITDSVLSQLVGHGLAARLSAKLGEGVLNGLLTARVGLAVIAICRPLPFLAGEEPKLQDVAGDILSNPLGKPD